MAENVPRANRVGEVLLHACTEDVAFHVEKLRAIGWPAEVVAVNEPEFFGLRIEIDLRFVKRPT